MLGSWAIFLSYDGDEPSKLVFVQRCQDSCLVMRDTAGISLRLGKVKWMLLEVRQETQGPFLVGHNDIGILINFQEESGIVTF